MNGSVLIATKNPTKGIEYYGRIPSISTHTNNKGKRNSASQSLCARRSRYLPRKMTKIDWLRYMPNGLEVFACACVMAKI